MTAGRGGGLGMREVSRCSGMDSMSKKSFLVKLEEAKNNNIVLAAIPT